MKLLLVKPDHFGDFILSVPALRALSECYELVLYVNPQVIFLAQYLFPEVQVRPMALPHLAKGRVHKVFDSSQLKNDSFDLPIFLRRDDALERLANLHFGSQYIMVSPSPSQHETIVQKNAIKQITGNYSRTMHFKGPTWPPRFGDPGCIGLCISSGFSGNSWPLNYWLALARLLLEKGARITLIGGPDEVPFLEVLHRSLRRYSRVCTLIGGNDFSSFLGQVATLDYVVASDSGTAHLCSLRTPIVSIFGPSPAARYAPFGRHNLLLTTDLYCSPCLQFDPARINHCVSRECLSNIRPEVVAGMLMNEETSSRRGVELRWGLSHSSKRHSIRPVDTLQGHYQKERQTSETEAPTGRK